MKSKIFTFVLLFAFVLSACGGAANNNAANNNNADHNNNMANNDMNDDAANDNAANENMADEDMADEDMAEAELLGTTLSALDGVEVEFWHVWDDDAGDALQIIIDDFNANNEYGITVVGYNQGNYGDVFNNMNAAINTGDLPDVVIGYNNQYLAWHAAGDIVVDLAPYVADGTVGLSTDEVADFNPVFWGQDDIDGVRYGVPAQRSVQTMFYNITWAQELGFDAPPASTEEFKAQACAAAADNGDGTGGWFINTGASTMAAFIFGFDGQIEAADGYTFDTPEAAAALSYMYDLYAEGCAWFPENRYPNPEFATRQGLFFTSSSAGLPYQVGAFEDAGTSDEWAPIAFPSVSGTPVVDVYGPSVAVISATAEEQLAAWIFVKAFTSTENQAAWVAATGYFPTRSSVDVEQISADDPLWAAAYALMEYGEFEPRFESWSSVRYALQDSAALLFQEDFDPATIPDLLAALQAEADELHAETK